MVVRSEDVNLVTEQFDELNRDFYGSDLGPSEYLAQRFRALLLSSGRSTLVEQAQQVPFDLDRVDIGWTADDALPACTRDFVTVESTVLLHHTAEALVRLFLSHRGLPACPWLESARQRYPRFKLNEAVESLQRALGEAATADALMQVFFGATERPEQYGDQLSPQMWNEQGAGLVALFGAASRLLMMDVGLYNATKHGLAIVAGDKSTTIEKTDAAVLMSADGPAVVFLDRSGARNAQRWERRVTWVVPETNLRLTLLMIQQLENLWTIARGRYTGSLRNSRTRLYLITADDVDRAIKVRGDGLPIPIHSVSTQLDYLPIVDAS